MKIFICLFVQIFSLSLFGQNSIGIVCDNFKINNEIRAEGADYRKSLESVLSNLKYPPLIIEREKIPELIIKIQEEVNLKKDLNEKDKGALKAANVDYIIYANFSKQLVNSTYDLQMECVKINGNNIFSKKAFPILTFTDKELNNTEFFRKKLSDMLNTYAFTEDFGILENEQLAKINERIEKRDAQIRNLDSALSAVKNDAGIKNITINNLSNSINFLQKDGQIKDQTIKELDAKINYINGSIALKEKKEFDIRHTPPEIDVKPKLDSLGNISIIVILLNDVPIELKTLIVSENSKPPSSNSFKINIPTNPKIYPSQRGVEFVKGNINSNNFPPDDVFDIRVEVLYWSIYMEESGMENLRKSFVKKYTVYRKKNSILEK